MRLLERLPYPVHQKIDAYVAYGRLPVNKRRVGKRGAVKKNEGWCWYCAAI